MIVYARKALIGRLRVDQVAAEVAAATRRDLLEAASRHLQEQRATHPYQSASVSCSGPLS